ncbi:MAG: hypothetical protein ACK4L7_04345 [Flavobacteriales bacterium]
MGALMRRRGEVAVLLAYLIAAALLTLWHEPWRDEYQALMLVRDSGSLSELALNSRYEGHPLGWFAILWALKPLGHDVRMAQAAHLAIISIAVAIVLWRAPLPLWQRAAVVFGYFFLYEYAVLFRNYAPSIALLAAICALLAAGGRWSFLWAGLLAALLPQFSAHSAFLLAGVGVAVGWRWTEGHRPVRGATLAFIVLLIAASTAHSYLHMRQPSDAGYFTEWNLSKVRLLRAVAYSWDAFFPIPSPEVAFWGKNILNGLLGGLDYNLVVVLKTLPAIAVWLFAIAALRGSKHALALFLTVSVLAIALGTTKYIGHIRHQGFVYMAFLAALWLRAAWPSPVPALLRNRHLDQLAAWRRPFIGALLGAQLVGAGVAAWFEARHDFSAAGRVAQYLRDRGLEQRFIVAERDYCTSTVAGELNRPLYYASSGRRSTYVRWDTVRKDSIPSDALVLIYERQRAGEPDALLLSSSELPDSVLGGLRELACFGPAILKDEVFWLYEVR